MLRWPETSKRPQRPRTRQRAGQAATACLPGERYINVKHGRRSSHPPPLIPDHAETITRRLSRPADRRDCHSCAGSAGVSGVNDPGGRLVAHNRSETADRSRACHGPPCMRYASPHGPSRRRGRIATERVGGPRRGRQACLPGERGTIPIMAEPSPTRRRWFQFGMGTMLLAVSLVAVTAWGTREYRERRRLEEVVRSHRAEIQRQQLLRYPPQLR
jgi:hypothetical protein